MRPQIVLFGDSITQQSFGSGGWGAALANTYSRKADIINRGYGGYNTRWALFLLHHIFPLVRQRDITRPTEIFLRRIGMSFFSRFVGLRVERSSEQNIYNQGSATPPAAVTVFFGANDAALSGPGRTSERQHVPVDEYKENLKKMVQHLKECSPSMLFVLITPPPVDEEGRFQYARSLYGENAMKLPERTNEVTGIYAEKCVELAKELDLPSINLWSKMQETGGWQKKFLSDGLHLTQEGNAVVYQEVLKVFEEAWLTASKMPYDFPRHSEIDPDNPEKAFKQRCLGV